MFKSKKERALELLISQRDKLDQGKKYHDVFWVAQTADLVKKYIGQGSASHTAILQIRFEAWISNDNTREQTFAAFEQKVREPKRCVDSCIEYIEMNGIHKEYKPNILARISDELVWGIYVGSIIVSFGVGVWWSKSPFNYEDRLPTFKQTLRDTSELNPTFFDSSNLNTNKPPKKKGSKN